MDTPDAEIPEAEPRKPRAIDGLLAHRLDARLLLNLLPHVNQSDLHTIRQEFARFLDVAAVRGRVPRRSSTGETVTGPYTVWQEAWNDFIGHRRVIEYSTPRCPDCRHGVSHRNISRNLTRTGNPHICGSCRGTGRGTRVTQQARPAPLPQD